MVFVSLCCSYRASLHGRVACFGWPLCIIQNSPYYVK